jgi:hypothetical protein
MTIIEKSLKEQLKELINKPCWFKEGILEIRKNSDANLIEIGIDYIVLKNQLFGQVSKIPIIAIQKIVRLDLININENDELLLKASNEGNIIEAEKALRNGANVNATNEKGTSALMYAAWGGYLKIVELLVEKGANINLITNGNALSGAAGLGYIEIVKYLINHGANVNQVVNNVTALDKATAMGRNKVVDLLKKHGAKSFEKSTSKKDGCFIATAVYGSPYAIEVNILKEFRDNWLLNFKLGKIFVTFYYWLSPPIANQIAKSKSLKTITKFTIIIPLIRIANHLKRKGK